MRMSVYNIAMKPFPPSGGIFFDNAVSLDSQTLLQQEEASCVNEMSASEFSASKQASKQKATFYWL